MAQPAADPKKSSAAGVSARALYEYALTRPLSRGGAPSGAIGHRKANRFFTWKYRHGIAQYARPLARSEVDAYGLLPVTSKDPYYEWLAKEHLYDDIVHTLIRRDTYVTDRGNGLIEVGIDFSRGHRWYVRTLDRIGSPVSDMVTFDSIDDVASAVWEMLPSSRKKEYLDVFDLKL